MIELELLSARPVEAIELAQPRPLEDLPTPALLLDETLLDANIAAMASHLTGQGKQARPHAKTHKCPLISRRQIAAGAVGVCVAKPAEAFVQALGGISDILLTSPVVTLDRVELLARTLQLAPEFKMTVDSGLGLGVAQAVARRAHELEPGRSDVVLGVVLDIDVEMGRTGNREVDALRQLAQQIAGDSRLALVGFQHYAGHVQHIEEAAQRQARSLGSWEAALSIVQQLRADGVPGDIVTGGGTGTFDIDTQLDAVTDLQVGSYIFMDAEYMQLQGLAEGSDGLPFQPALTLQTTVISQPAERSVTLDCGYKSMASETVPPEFLDLAGARFRFMGDEQGMAIPAKGSQQPLLGTKLRMLSPHCDPTVNLYDYYWVHREGYAHSLWPITGRGCVW